LFGGSLTQHTVIQFTADIVTLTKDITTIKATTSGFDALTVTGPGLQVVIATVNNGGNNHFAFFISDQFNGAPLPSSLDPTPNIPAIIPNNARKVEVIFTFARGTTFASNAVSPIHIAFSDP